MTTMKTLRTMGRVELGRLSAEFGRRILALLPSVVEQLRKGLHERNIALGTSEDWPELDRALGTCKAVEEIPDSDGAIRFDIGSFEPDYPVTLSVLCKNREHNGQTALFMIPSAVWIGVEKLLTAEEMRFSRLLFEKSRTEYWIDQYNRSKHWLSDLGVDLNNPRIW